MPPAGFEPTIAASERLYTHSLDRAATGIGRFVFYISQLKHVEGKTVANRLLNRIEILKFTRQ